MAEADYSRTDAVPWEPARSGSPRDDFYCLRFAVWYPSYDCAFRTRFRTSHGCLDCEQGRFNLKRHAEALRGARFPFPPADANR